MSSPTNILRLRIPALGLTGSPVEWLLLDAAGQMRERGCTQPDQLPTAPAIELIIPASRVALHTLELPAGAGKHETAVMRQQLEDRVLGELADSHIVRGERQGSKLAVWVVSRQWMLDLLAACRSNNLAATRVIPEQLLLPAQSFAQTEDGFVYRSSLGACGSLPEEALLEPVCGEALSRVENLLACPATSALDLLQGLPALRPSAKLSRPLLKLVASLLLALAGAWLLSLILDWRQLAAQEVALRETIRQNFAAAHPGMPIIDPILQWRQLHSKQNKQGGDALDQLAQLAELTAVSIRPQRLEAEAQTIKLTLSSSDAALLKPALQAKGIKFDSQTTDRGLEQLTLTRSAEGAKP